LDCHDANVRSPIYQASRSLSLAKYDLVPASLKNTSVLSHMVANVYNRSNRED
jgi:hypothetical protein